MTTKTLSPQTVGSLSIGLRVDVWDRDNDPIESDRQRVKREQPNYLADWEVSKRLKTQNLHNASASDC